MAKKQSGGVIRNRGDVVEMTITSMAPGGEAFGKADDLPVFIERGAPGDVVEVELFDVRKKFAKGKIARFIKPSPDRQEPPCKLFKVCGGCQWQHLEYSKQLAHKTSIVKQAMQHIGGLDSSIVKDCMGAENPLFYRNKVQFPVRNPKDSTRILAGYFKPDSHELVNIKHCPVQSEALDRMLETVKEVLELHEIPAYNERSGDGIVRHIHARESRSNGTILVTLVVNLEVGDYQEVLEAVADEILARHEQIIGVAVNYNTMRGNRILGDTTVLIDGEDAIEEVLRATDERFPLKLKDGLKFKLSPTSFFQVNTDQAVRLLEVVYDEAFGTEPQAVKIPLVVDAYAGVGAISLFLSPGAVRISAIEEFPQAVIDGRFNTEINEIRNVEFIEGSVEEVLPQFHDTGDKIDLLVLDPPRKGVSPEVLRSVVDLAPPRIIYVSCNPATLARDLKLLANGGIDPYQKPATIEIDDQGQETRVVAPDDGNRPIYGYKTLRIQPIDLFPQTYHVESVATLERVLLDGPV